MRINLDVLTNHLQRLSQYNLGNHQYNHQYNLGNHNQNNLCNHNLGNRSRSNLDNHNPNNHNPNNHNQNNLDNHQWNLQQRQHPAQSLQQRQSLNQQHLWS
tara:strand:- start:1699 stop:2001 length:303 start_codon:yes stop_codon:yes gene_type:complete